MNSVIQHMIQQLKDIQSGKLWIGSSYDSKLSSVSEHLIFTRPMPHMHSIAEIISHLTLWRQETLLKINTGKGSKTDDCDENWLSNDMLKSKGWSQIKNEYDQTLADMIHLLKDKEDTFLNEQYYDTDFKDDYPYSFVLNGMLHHDIYHLGQLGLIIKFLNENISS